MEQEIAKLQAQLHQGNAAFEEQKRQIAQLQAGIFASSVTSWFPFAAASLAMLGFAFACHAAIQLVLHETVFLRFRESS